MLKIKEEKPLLQNYDIDKQMVFAFAPGLVSDINSKYVVRDNLYDDIVVFQFGKKGQDPTIITVNCLDKAGLVSDLTRTILEFGLDVNRAGNFCFFFVLA